MKTRMAIKNPCHPGEIIREDVLAPFGLNITQAAKVLGVTRLRFPTC
jgi:plasmid maintenance system antidote protein VapI